MSVWVEMAKFTTAPSTAGSREDRCVLMKQNFLMQFNFNRFSKDSRKTKTNRITSSQSHTHKKKHVTQRTNQNSITKACSPYKARENKQKPSRVWFRSCT